MIKFYNTVILHFKTQTHFITSKLLVIKKKPTKKPTFYKLLFSKINFQNFSENNYRASYPIYFSKIYILNKYYDNSSNIHSRIRAREISTYEIY